MILTPYPNSNPNPNPNPNPGSTTISFVLANLFLTQKPRTQQDNSNNNVTRSHQWKSHLHLSHVRLQTRVVLIERTSTKMEQRRKQKRAVLSDEIRATLTRYHEQGMNNYNRRDEHAMKLLGEAEKETGLDKDAIK